MDKYFSAFPSDDATLERHQADIREQERRDACLDEALSFTFPASDPVALDCSFASLPSLARDQLRVTSDFFFKLARP